MPDRTYVSGGGGADPRVGNSSRLVMFGTTFFLWPLRFRLIGARSPDAVVAEAPPGRPLIDGGMYLLFADTLGKSTGAGSVRRDREKSCTKLCQH